MYGSAIQRSYNPLERKLAFPLRLEELPPLNSFAPLVAAAPKRSPSQGAAAPRTDSLPWRVARGRRLYMPFEYGVYTPYV